MRDSDAPILPGRAVGVVSFVFVDSQLPPECKCSFCGKWNWQVKRLVGGQTAYICDECIELCVDILSEDVLVPSEGP
jgi:hypothetical protein